MEKSNFYMLSTSYLLLVAIIAGAAADDGVGLTGKFSRKVCGLLTVTEPYEAGVWGQPEFCPQDSFVHGIRTRLEPKGARDETAINAIKLYCRAKDGDYDNNYVISARAFKGKWIETQSCPDGFMTSFRARVRPEGGLLVDNTALQDFQGMCGNELIRGVPLNQQFRSGQWSRWMHCPPHSAVCGLMTRVQNNLMDDVALTDAQLFCCPLEA